ncbi:hypothetical protein ACFE04_008963 [Oxalis oulophora]
MEKSIEVTPIKGIDEPENKIVLENKTPTSPRFQSTTDDHQTIQVSEKYDLRKISTPDVLKVPKAFKYPERYRSPTDSMMSPVSKGLLARNRKAAALLPPSINQTKIQELHVQDPGLCQSKSGKNTMPLDLLEN